MTSGRRPSGPQPDQAESQRRRAARSNTHEGVQTGGSLDALRILVVEDDALIGMLLSDLLSSMGHLCIVAATGAGAVDDAIRHRPDLMIVDARLGDCSGIAAMDEILRAGPMPHLFVSGDARQVSALRPDAVVLQKPFREADLTRAIRQVVGASRA